MNNIKARKSCNKLTEILLSGITHPCDVCSNTKCNNRKVYNMQTKNEPKTVNDYLELVYKYIELGDKKQARECLKKANELQNELWEGIIKDTDKQITGLLPEDI